MTVRLSSCDSLFGTLALAVATLASPARAQTLTPDAWVEDLRTMVQQLEAQHASLYHTVTRDSFHQAVDNLALRIPQLADNQIVVELARLVALVGDGHTLIPLLWDGQLGFRRLPIELMEAEDGLLILASAPEYPNLAGARVTKIGGTSAEAAIAAVSPLISRDNPLTVRSLAAGHLVVPEILNAVGIGEEADTVSLEVEYADGSNALVRLPALERAALPELQLNAPLDSLPLWLRNRDEAYWLTYLPDSRTVYVQYNRADFDKEEESVAAFGRRLVGLVAEGDVARVVVDLRWNSGGSRWRARHLLNAIIRVEGLLGDERATQQRSPSGNLFTIIGPQTFSAAMQFALDLGLHTNTTYVGLPTGGKPNSYGEVGRFRLPNSGVQVRYSVFYHQASHPRDTRDAIGPDVSVDLSLADYRNGEDPALKAILDSDR